MHLRTPNSNLPKLDADSALCILGNCCATIGKYFHTNKTQKFKLPHKNKVVFSRENKGTEKFQELTQGSNTL